MSRTYDADGETWEVYLSSDRPHEGVRALVFTCVTNSSRGWRVVEVPAVEYPDDRVDGLDEPELEALFDRSAPFDYPHDPKARPDHIGEPPQRHPHEGP